jgi:hypothetical protein
VTGSRLGNQENTRCLGNYLVKGGYKEFDELVSARVEPVIAEPEIHGGIQLDESCRYHYLKCLCSLLCNCTQCRETDWLVTCGQNYMCTTH